MKERESVFLKDSIKLEQLSKINEVPLTNMNLNNYQSKEEKLFSQKSFLEIILNRIKICQNHLLTNNLSKKNLKIYLMDLKSDLSNLESDKKLGIKYIEKK